VPKILVLVEDFDRLEAAVRPLGFDLPAQPMHLESIVASHEHFLCR
jgi:hypothetical protein